MLFTSHCGLFGAPFPGALSCFAELVPRPEGPTALFAILAGNFPDTHYAKPLQSYLIAALAKPTCELPQVAFSHGIILICLG
jgi:hypothetical protein